METVLWLTSEIVTNAVRYGKTTSMAMCLLLAKDALRISVNDNVADAPTLRVPTHLDERGRGLMLLNALSTEWGTTYSGNGKIVWFQLNLTQVATSHLKA